MMGSSAARRYRSSSIAAGLPPPFKVLYGAIVLAAGASTRMGRPKQLLTYQGQSLLRRAASAAVTAVHGPVAVVLGAHAEKIYPELEGLPVWAVENPDWAEGMGASIRTGMQALLRVEPGLAGVLLLLCDQPHVQASSLKALLEAHERTEAPVVASAYGEVLGVPAFFEQSFFDALLQLKGQEGARKVIVAYPEAVLAVPFPEGAVDVDTPGDYEGLFFTQ
jgi:molybdenum cofactor cytidylyltransferase